MKYILITSLFAAFFAIQIPAQNYSKNTLNLSELSPEKADDQPSQVNAGFNTPVQDYGRKSNVSLYYRAGVSLMKMTHPSDNYATIQHLKSHPTAYFGLGTSIRLGRKVALEFELNGFKTKGKIEGVHYGDLLRGFQGLDTLSTYDENIELNCLNFQGAAKIRFQPFAGLPVFISAGQGFQWQVNNLSVFTQTETVLVNLFYVDNQFVYKKLDNPYKVQQTGHYDDDFSSFGFLFAIQAIPFPNWSKKVSLECGVNVGLLQVFRFNIHQHFLNLGVKCKI